MKIAQLLLLNYYSSTQNGELWAVIFKDWVGDEEECMEVIKKLGEDFLNLY